MYRYYLDQVKDEKNITKIIARFKSFELPRYERLQKYYAVENAILSRRAKDGKPNNKLAHGFAKYITKMATGYFMGKPVRYLVPDDCSVAELDEYRKLLTETLNDNYTHSANFEIAKEASKKGVAYELIYIDEKSRLRTKKMNAEEIIPIYSPSIGEFLEAAIRIWGQEDIDGNITEYAALYTDCEIFTYAKPPNKKKYALVDTAFHGLKDIPIIAYWNNEEQKGDYEDILSIIDAYDKAQSDTANDSEYFADAYMVITGALGGMDDGMDSDDPAAAYKSMRRERVIELDENSRANWLVKDINDTAQENYKNRLYRDIFFISQVPPLSDESFAGNLTGVAIRYKLIGLEELTTEKEHKFLAAQKKKIRIITDFINEIHNKSFNADVVEIKFQRNFIDNLTEYIEQARGVEGIVSRETQLGLLPMVEDVNKELQRISGEEE